MDKNNAKFISEIPSGITSLTKSGQRIKASISVQELSFILLLRQFKFGTMTVHKMEGEVRRVETSQSALIDDKLMIEQLAKGDPQELEDIVAQLRLTK